MFCIYLFIVLYRYEEREAVELSKKLDALEVNEEKSVEATGQKKILPRNEEIKPKQDKGNALSDENSYTNTIWI